MLCFSTSVGRLQAATYFLSTIVSFFVVIPVGITLRDFQGSCVLYAQVVWDERTLWPWTETCCDFILYMNIALTMLYAFWMGIYCIFVSVPNHYPFAKQYMRVDEDEPNVMKEIEKHDQKFRIDAVNPVFVLVNAVIVLIVMSSAVVITVGLQRLCNWMLVGLEDLELKSCASAQTQLPWDEFKIIRGDTVGVKGDRFYICLFIATIASWILFFIWLFQWILNISQSFTWCSCEIAEEKRKPDSAVLIAARRSRMATPIGTPGHMTPGGHGTPPFGGGAPMRPFTFGPPPRHQQPHMMQPGQQAPPIHLQQGYAPRSQYPPPGVRRSQENLVDQPGQPRPHYPPPGHQPPPGHYPPPGVRRSREDLVDRPGQPRPQYPPQGMRRSREDLVDRPGQPRPQYPPQGMRPSREDLVDRPGQGRPPQQYPPQPMRRSREDLVERPGQPPRPQEKPQPARKPSETQPRQEYRTPPARMAPEHSPRR